MNGKEIKQKLFDEAFIEPMKSSACLHEWRQYAHSDRYYCTNCLAQIVLEDNLTDKVIRIRSFIKGLE